MEVLAAILAAIHRFCSRSSKTTRQQIETRLAQLEALAAEVGTPHAEPAAQALLLLAGLRFKAADDLEEVSRPLLRRSPQPGRLLARALLDLRLLGPTRPWHALVEDLRQQDPQNGLLVLAVATMQRPGSFYYQRISAQAFDLARRQQDSEALAACRREEWWEEECQERQLARQRTELLLECPEWGTMLDQLNLPVMLRNLMREQGMPSLSEAQLEAMLPEFELTLARSFQEMQANGVEIGSLDDELLSMQDELLNEPIEEAQGKPRAGG